MFYPDDFKERVKKAYPYLRDLHHALDNGDPIVGVYLSECRPAPITLETILLATSLEELQEKARIEKEKTDLWQEWLKNYY